MTPTCMFNHRRIPSSSDAGPKSLWNRVLQSPPGCPRSIYKLMVDYWWVQQWLASQNLLLKLATVTRGYIYGVNTANWRWAFALEYSMNMCYSWMPTARRPTCSLVYNSVEFAMFEKCLCSHNTTPHFQATMHISHNGPFTTFLCLHKCWD